MNHIVWNKNFTNIKCLHCKISKEVPMWKISQGKAKFCSRECYLKYHNKTVVCKNCNKDFNIKASDVNRGRGKFCSHKCAQKYMIGPKHGSWNIGEKMNAYGYIMIWCNRNDRKYQYIHEHRLVMENQIGRKLSRREVVHHINGNKTDNTIQNLILFKDQKTHVKFEHAKKVPIKNIIFNGAL